MEWTATAKELESTGFRVGLDKIFKDFKWMYAVVIPMVAGKFVRRVSDFNDANYNRNDISRDICSKRLHHHGFHSHCTSCQSSWMSCPFTCKFLLPPLIYHIFGN